ncbi:hypothetical protein ANRL3_01797 [Anaerolineae bacterium]|nr:hypothetical protein ANRL3_01797 [Anaerolineae bacterium]
MSGLVNAALSRLLDTVNDIESDFNCVDIDRLLRGHNESRG